MIHDGSNSGICVGTALQVRGRWLDVTRVWVDPPGTCMGRWESYHRRIGVNRVRHSKGARGE